MVPRRSKKEQINVELRGKKAMHGEERSMSAELVRALLL